MEDMLRYLDEIADPTVAEFEQNPTCRRHAFLACVAVFHAIDYLEHFPIIWNRKMLCNSLFYRVFGRKTGAHFS